MVSEKGKSCPSESCPFKDFLVEMSTMVNELRTTTELLRVSTDSLKENLVKINKEVDNLRTTIYGNGRLDCILNRIQVLWYFGMIALGIFFGQASLNIIKIFLSGG